jgi:hypothetical protein
MQEDGYIYKRQQIWSQCVLTEVTLLISWNSISIKIASFDFKNKPKSHHK